MKLHNYWRSSSSWRVRVALAHKGLTYEYVSVHLVEDGGQQHKAEFKTKNPSAQVPVLEVEIDGVTRYLSQSLAILDFLEETHPEPALLPGDAFGRAQARRLAELVNSGIQPLQNLSVIQKLQKMDVPAKTWCAEWIESGLATYEEILAESGGKFSVGDQVSWADACLIPQLYNARRFEVDLAAFPRILAVEEACNALDAFKASHPDAQPDAQ